MVLAVLSLTTSCYVISFRCFSDLIGALSEFRLGQTSGKFENSYKLDSVNMTGMSHEKWSPHLMMQTIIVVIGRDGLKPPASW